MPYSTSDFGLKTDDVVGFTPSQRTAVEMQVCVSIADEATWLYRNVKHPRHKNFYGYAQIMSGAFVVETVALNFLNQEILHWRDETWGINETTGCYAKGIASALNPPFALITNTVKTRQRYTSIRFRLLPGILANVILAWETAQAFCGGNILEPDANQGQPPNPKNSSYNPGNRPPDQGGDDADLSPNDGRSQPGDGLPDEPQPGAGSGAQWKYIITWSNGTPTAGTLNDFDSSSVWQSGGVCFAGQEGNSDPNGAINGISFYKNGVYFGCAEDGSKGNALSMEFEYTSG